MKPKHNFLFYAVIFFVIGFLANPLILLLHLPTDVSQVIVSINWISGGLACVVFDTFHDESKPPPK